MITKKAMRYPATTRTLRHLSVFPGRISTVTWCQSIIDNVMDHPCNQEPDPSSNVPIGQIRKKYFNQSGKLWGGGGGARASNILRNIPAIVQKVRPVSHEIRRRGLRVTTYNPNQQAIIKAI